MLFRSIRSDSQYQNTMLIPSLVDKYESEVKNGVAPPTKAWFLQAQQSRGPTCTLFRLLKAFSRLEKNESKSSLSSVIAPSGHNPNQFDVSTSFHLAVILSSLEVCSNLTESEECALMDSFAAQLLSAGKWEWAVYVTLCSLHEPSGKLIACKKRMAKSIIDKHFAPYDDEHARIRRSFLEEKVGVPSAWFEEALSNYALHVGDAKSYLLHSTHLASNEALKRYEEALLPDALFNRDYNGIAEILSTMDGQGTKRTTLQGVVYEYLKLTNDFMELATKSDSDESRSDNLLNKALHIQHELSNLQGEKSVPWKSFSGLPCVPRKITLTELSSSLTLLINRLYDIKAGRRLTEKMPGTSIAMKGASVTNALSRSNDDLFFNELDPKSFLRVKYSIGKTAMDIDDDSTYRPNRYYLG
mmetsp:Transcript_4706/g.5426  ORF Transcript_4706/g.5426 Transcript_4706/m.5426 type:complete len:414 (-) Transcript_4706:147-1388(-)